MAARCWLRCSQVKALHSKLRVLPWCERRGTYGACRALKHADAAVLDGVKERSHQRELDIVRDGVRKVEGARACLGVLAVRRSERKVCGVVGAVGVRRHRQGPPTRGEPRRSRWGRWSKLGKCGEFPKRQGMTMTGCVRRSGARV